MDDGQSRKADQVRITVNSKMSSNQTFISDNQLVIAFKVGIAADAISLRVRRSYAPTEEAKLLKKINKGFLSIRFKGSEYLI
jgi:hypothetical protein